MKFLWFWVCLGGSYGVLHTFVANDGVAGVLAWLVGLPLYFASVGVVRAWRTRRLWRQLDAEERETINRLMVR